MLKTQPWFFDSQTLMIEIDQCRDEGKDVTGLKERAEAIQAMTDEAAREAAAAAFLDETYALPLMPGTPYVEPSDLPSIVAESRRIQDLPCPDKDTLYDKALGAWLLRCAGCLLGKPFEGAKRHQIEGILNGTDNNPPAFYTKKEGNEALIKENDWDIGRAWIDTVDGMPEDDDTNYTTLAVKLLDLCGRDFTPEDVAERWLADLPILHVCTAERVAYRNLVAMRLPPLSASFRNAYREWIGAQIRGDYFGYINPGRMEAAADMAWRDASISHVKNGIYGEMWAAACIAAAYSVRSLDEVLDAGLAVIPQKSRLHEALTDALTWPSRYPTYKEALAHFATIWDEYNPHHWCHTISNAVLVEVALLYGGLDPEKTLGIALLPGFDTDCNCATAGSILGAFLGAKALPEKWIAPLHDTLHTGVDGYNRVSISDMARRTLTHMA